MIPRARPYFLEALMPRAERRERVRCLVERKWVCTRALQSFTVSGASMGPDFASQGRLCVQFCEPDELHVGDLIYIRRHRVRIVHRLVARVGPFVIEKGDANNYYGVHWRSSVLGKVVSVGTSDARSE